MAARLEAARLRQLEEVVAINEDTEEVEDDEAEIEESFPSRLAWSHVLLDPALLCVELRRHRFQAMVSAAMGCLPLLGWHTLSRAAPRNVGPPANKFDKNGNYNLGITDQLIFPEIDYEQVDQMLGLNITIVTSAKNSKEGLALLNKIGIPFSK